MYKVIVKNKDVSEIIGNLTWRDTVDTLGVEVEFDLPVNKYDEKFEFLYDITLGDTIQILNNKGETLIQAIIVTETPNGKITSFIGYDMAWYLNKSTVINRIRH